MVVVRSGWGYSSMGDQLLVGAGAAGGVVTGVDSFEVVAGAAGGLHFGQSALPQSHFWHLRQSGLPQLHLWHFGQSDLLQSHFWHLTQSDLPQSHFSHLAQSFFAQVVVAAPSCFGVQPRPKTSPKAMGMMMNRRMGTSTVEIRTVATRRRFAGDMKDRSYCQPSSGLGFQQLGQQPPGKEQPPLGALGESQESQEPKLSPTTAFAGTENTLTRRVPWHFGQLLVWFSVEAVTMNSAR